MQKLFYNSKDIMELTGYSQSKSYKIIKRLNQELIESTKAMPINEKPLILSGRINKEYFDKRIKV